MVTLIILDGFGERKDSYGNAIASAGTPNLDKLKKMYPHTLISASGLSVGLPDGQMGNSEVGHMTIGAGRVILQDLLKIDNDIKSGEFFKNENLIKALEHAQNNKSNLHIMGLLSEGGIHSKVSHLYSILELAKNYDIKNIYIHAFLDGRDCGVQDGIKFLRETQEKINGTNAKIATLCGRIFAMDREERYDRLQKAYDMLVYGKGEKFDNFEDAVKTSYAKGVNDEFFEPTIIQENAYIEENDSVIFYNYRSDRAREITFAITDPSFDKFETKKFNNLLFSPMEEYSDKLTHLNTLFPPTIVEDNLSRIISDNNMKQFHIAETTKYAHVTFFFNGGIEQANVNEDRKLIDSIDTPDFSYYPKMRAIEITQEMLDAIASNKYDFLLVNYSNPDMIGHTGNFNASVEAIQCVEKQAYAVALATLMAGGECIITADHGNAEEVMDKNGNKMTAHTTNPVPFILVSDKNKNVKLNKKGSLANIAPTVLKLLGIEIPSNMEKPLF